MARMPVVPEDYLNGDAADARVLGDVGGLDLAGLSPGQIMTPQTSADAALKWLQYRGSIHDKSGKPVSYQGHYRALERYNVGKGTINGVPAAEDYANTVMNNARASYGNGQPQKRQSVMLGVVCGGTVICSSAGART